MANSYTQIVIHAVFVVKDRDCVITPEIRDDFHAYIAGILRARKHYVYAVGGWMDHVHILFALMPTESLSSVIGAVKASSTNYMNQELRKGAAFSWQAGYSAFSCSYNHRLKTIAYIQNQEAHHKTKTFKQEYEEWLSEERFEIDARYGFDYFE